MSRTIAIGDIHGCAAALKALLDIIAPAADDRLITMGDYVDRGPDTRQVIDELLTLGERCQLVPLLGNHEELLLAARASQHATQYWLHSGGGATLASYGIEQASQLPADHVRFFEDCRLFYETSSHFFVHANYQPNVELAKQDRRPLLWTSLRDEVPPRHCSGKVAVVGHTPQKEILNLGYLIDVDTGCCYGGWLTALDVDSGQIWQADARGNLRGEPGQPRYLEPVSAGCESASKGKDEAAEG